jgi:hypothetical protein
MSVGYFSILSKKIAAMTEADRKSLVLVGVFGCVSLTYFSKNWYITKYFRRIIPIVVSPLLLYRWINFRSDQETVLSIILRMLDQMSSPFLLLLLKDILGIYTALSGAKLLFSLTDLSISELKLTLTSQIFDMLQHIPMVKSMVSLNNTRLHV